MSFDWSSLFLAAGLFNVLILLGLVFLSNRGPKGKKEKVWFSIVGLGIALIIFEGIIRGSQIFLDYPHFLFICTPVYFLIQPALLFYQAAYQKRKIRYWPHLILPLLNLVIMMQTFRMSEEDKLAMFQAEDAQDPIWIVAIYVTYFSFYQYLLFKSHKAHTRRLEAEFSQSDLEWNRLSGFITAAAGIALFAIPAGILAQYLSLPEQQNLIIIKSTNVAFSMVSHVLLFALLITPDLKRPTVTAKEKPVEAENYAEQVAQLKSFMAANKVYLNNELSLNLLASEIGWSRSLLSAVINKGFAINFYDFVNGYRLQEFETRIVAKEHQSYTLDHLVQECGFTNYVSFFRYVKRKMNVSPSGLIKQIEARQ